jgi:hypothetical protein
VEIFRDQRVGKTEHHRGVGARPAGKPFGIKIIGGVGAVRPDIDELYAAVPRGPQRIGQPMPPRAAALDLGVLHRDAAEHNHKLAVFDDGLERGRLAHELPHIDAEDVR